MKVYVDELPKDCIGCPCESEYYCNLLNEDVGFLKLGEVHQNCPLQSLSDYTKQVRKEIVQQIKGALREKLIKVTDDAHFYSQNAVHWQDIVAILDQIQD